MDHRTRALRWLERVDRGLEARFGALASLAPRRPRASRLAELAERALPPGAGPGPTLAFARGLARVVHAFAEHFPDNLFWDADLLAARLAAQPDPASTGALSARVVELCAHFGRSSPIRFRYLHDFLFGYDWCRWVARAPAERRDVGPFDPPFLGYLLCRAGELRALIDRDDATYGRLPDDGFRNPFPFAREPGDEARLYRTLAERDLIPVRAWQPDASPRWDLPYTELRQALADELGIARRPT
ncbi:MAG TPA: ferrochelatase [Polyangiaceae bacterium]|nr:ferrochelatase [Polyangiaceae bacterium]